MRTSVLVGYIKCRSQVLTVPHYTTSVVTHSAHKENRSGRVSKRAPTCATSRPARTHARLHACASSHRLRLRPLSPSHPPLAPRCAAMRPPAFAPPTVVAAPPPRPPPATAAGACRWHRCYRRRRVAAVVAAVVVTVVAAIVATAACRSGRKERDANCAPYGGSCH